MRRSLIILALAAAAASSLPASAVEQVRLEHSAPVPCSVLCSHWLADHAGSDPCAQPFPPGSYDKTLFTLTATTGTVEIEAQSFVDYDTFACTNTTPSKRIPLRGDMLAPEDCHHPLVQGAPWLGLGCTEHGEITRAGLHSVNGAVNDEFFLVSYNRSDNGHVHLRLTGPVAIVDDSFEPSLT